MEYEDELERMKARKKPGNKKRSNGQRMNSNANKQHNYDAEELRRYRIQQKKKKRKRKILIAELVILAALLIFSYWFFTKKDNDGYWNIAVFGVDSRDGNLGKGTLADVQMICSINRKTGEVKLVSVFRDTYLKINSKGTYHKINEAYFKGGPGQAIDALEENLDLNIDDYATFNWKTVANVINILGGIDLEITDKEYPMINSFITETVNSTGIPSVHLKGPGMNHLDGVQAVAYSRLRLMDTDFNRTERQRKVVSLTLEKAKQADFSALNNILVTVLPQVSTSVGLDDLIPLAKTIKNFKITETTGFPFARTTGDIGKLDCVIPLTLESNVIELHRVLYGIENYTPSSGVKKISKKIAEDSGLDEEGKITHSSGGNKSQNTSKPTAAPETVPETSIEETTTEPETTETETTEAETGTEAPETEASTNPDGSLVGPGANTGETKPPQTTPAETTEKETEEETTKALETKPVKPVETPEAPGETEPENGPGVEVGPGVS